LPAGPPLKTAAARFVVVVTVPAEVLGPFVLHDRSR
jgi:hypothetical protein